MPYYSMPMRARPADRGHHPRRHVLHRPRAVHGVARHVAEVGHHDGGQAGDPADRPVQRDPRRAGPDARRGPGPDRRRLSRGGPRPVPPAHPGAGHPRHRAARAARQALRRLPRVADAAQERARRGPRAGPRRWPIWRTRPRWCWPAAGAGATSWTRRSRPCRPTCGWSGPATCRSPTCPASSAARCVVAAPSRGEGFGLPVLEAMACGAPVLTTYRTSLPEVGGDAVAYTEPEAESIATALRALLDDPAAADGPRRGRARPGQGVHLGRVGGRARGELQAGGGVPVTGSSVTLGITLLRRILGVSRRCPGAT